MKNIIRVDIKISIHAPREGGDFRVFPEDTTPFNFNPRPPRGGRHEHPYDWQHQHEGNFNPRPPRGGRLYLAMLPLTSMGHISIHAPREGGDGPQRQGKCQELISIHAPREGGDQA